MTTKAGSSGSTVRPSILDTRRKVFPVSSVVAMRTELALVTDAASAPSAAFTWSLMRSAVVKSAAFSMKVSSFCGPTRLAFTGRSTVAPLGRMPDVG